jgi:hypothetical protein
VGGAVLAGRRSGSVGAGDGAARCAAEDDDSAAAPDAWTAMLDWLQGLGAVLNVDVVDGGPATGRFVVASRPLAPGQLLAAIPTDACWSIQHEGGDADLEVCRGGAFVPASAVPVWGAEQACAWCLLGPCDHAVYTPLHTHTHPSQLAGANLLADMAEGEANARHPYFEALPAQDELVCPLLMLPASYGHLLQHPLVVRVHVWPGARCCGSRVCSAPQPEDGRTMARVQPCCTTTTHLLLCGRCWCAQEDTVAGAQQLVSDFWDEHQQAIRAKVPDATLADFVHARSLVRARVLFVGVVSTGENGVGERCACCFRIRQPLTPPLWACLRAGPDG